MEVVKVHDIGSDWIVRDFYKFSDELSNAKIAEPVIEKVMQLLKGSSNDILQNLLKKLS